MKEYIAEDLGCKFRWNPEVKELEFAGILKDGTFDDWNLVEPDLVGEEEVTFQGKLMTLYEVYAIVKKELGVIS